jgi:putative heme-binding domain-containing protein
VGGLIAELGNANLTRRMLAMNQLVDRIGQPAVHPVEKMLRNGKSSAEQRAHGLWVLHRLGALRPETLAVAVHDADRMVRVHAQRVMSEMSPETGMLPSQYRQFVFEGLNDRDPYVQRAAVDALGRHAHGTEHGDYEPVHRLLDLLRRIPTNDVQLLHVCRMALRSHLRPFGAFPYLKSQNLTEQDSKTVASIALGVPGEEPASFLLKHVKKFPESRDRLAIYLRHAARYAPEPQLDDFGKLIREQFNDDLDFQFAFFNSAQDGLAQRGAKLSDGLRVWAAELAEKLLAPMSESSATWVSLPLPDTPTASPWFVQKRKSADGDEASVFFCTLPPGGEMLTGTLRSGPFKIPPKLSFFLAGHDGFPNQPTGQKNFIRLLAADTREVLARTSPPRNDLAQRVTWDLSAHAGRRGFIEVVDGDTGTAYAWLAVGRFDPLVVPLPATDPGQPVKRQLDAANLARTVPLPQLAPRFAGAFKDNENSDEFRAAAAQVLITINSPTYLGAVVETLADTNQPAALRQRLASVLADQNSPTAREAVLGAMVTAPHRLQIKLALSLAGNPAGAEALLSFAEQKKLSPQVLVDRAVQERLTAAKLPQFEERLGALTHGLVPASAELQKLMDERRAGFASAQVSAERGKAVFEKTCSVCHQLAGQGAVVGPQLDGVGNRGLERIIEDVLDPSRNVDSAFRPSLVTLRDDTSITGLQRREEGEVLVFVDPTGKEIVVPKKEIAERRESQLSLMPSNFGEALPAGEFYDLMAFLFGQGLR